MKRKRYGYQVKIVIERFEYDPKVGTCKREVLDAPQSPHQDWSLGDYQSVEEADGAVAAMIHQSPYEPELCRVRCAKEKAV